MDFPPEVVAEAEALLDATLKLAPFRDRDGTAEEIRGILRRLDALLASAQRRKLRPAPGTPIDPETVTAGGSAQDFIWTHSCPLCGVVMGAHPVDTVERHLRAAWGIRKESR